MSVATWVHRLDALAPALTDAALRGVVVFLVALAITHAMRRRTAAGRHLVWVGAIVVQLALPLFAVWGPQWQVAVPTVVSSVLPVTLPVGRVDETRSPAIAPRPVSPQAREPIHLTITNDGVPSVGGLPAGSVAHPAPVMKSYIAVRKEGEAEIRATPSRNARRARPSMHAMRTAAASRRSR